MPLRPLVILAASCTTLAVSSSAGPPTAWDLGAAFQATFGRLAPVTRLVERPRYDIDQHKVVGYDSPEMEFWPDRLVRVDENRLALITRETNKNAAHSSRGAIAVS